MASLLGPLVGKSHYCCNILVRRVTAGAMGRASVSGCDKVTRGGRCELIAGM